MTRRLTSCLSDPAVAALTKEINAMQREMTHLRNKRRAMVIQIYDQKRKRADYAKYRETRKKASLAYYYRVVRPKLRPHLCKDEVRA